jgi:nucleoside-diphosphate-sugar epimerase
MTRRLGSQLRNSYRFKKSRLPLISGVPLIDGVHYHAGLIYVENLVEGMLLAGTLDIAKGKTYHFRDDWDVTWKQYLTDLGAMIGKNPSGNIPFPLAWITGAVCEKIFTPFNVRPPYTRFAVGLVGRHQDIDNTKAKTELGWKTCLSYDEAIKQIHDWG